MASERDTRADPRAPKGQGSKEPRDEPSGTPWDSPLSEVPFAFVDLEMTGLDVETERVVEVCIERVVGGVCVARLDSLVWPGDERAGGASEVHGLSREVLTGAPPFASLAEDVRRLLDGAVPVAHAASWDARFLRKELERAGTPMDLAHWIDTLALSRRSFLLPNHSLSALRVHFGLAHEGSHRAAADVTALRQVFDRCVDVLRPVSPRDLWETRVAGERVRAAVTAALVAAQASGAPIKVAVRGGGRPIRELVVRVTEIHAAADPPRAIGYLLPGRGRTELRIDRVLRVEAVDEPPT